MLARFVLEIHAWAIPLLFATGWVIGYSHFRSRFHRKHPELYAQWAEKTYGPRQEGQEQ
jgi:hypothetical protein